jgi:hypothetical protein
MAAGHGGASAAAIPGSTNLRVTMNPVWIWMQVAIVVFVAIGIVVAIVRLA